MKKNKDKFRGCLIGGAAGDALGYAVEFCRYSEIISKYGQDGITEYMLKNGKALISDDTQMTLFTAAAFLQDSAEEFPDEAVRNCYKDWYLTQTMPFDVVSESVKGKANHSFLLQNRELFNRRAPGCTCMNAIGEGALGTPEDPINDSKGCGGIMRVAPIGLYYTDSSADVGKIASFGGIAAAMTHGHELGYIPSAAFTYIIHQLSRGETSVKKASLDSLDVVSDLYPDAEYLEYFCSLINDAIRLAESGADDAAALDELGEGWVAEETLAVAVYCSVKYPNDFDKALTVSVNHDGDSDSTGAVTGNILGALIGYDAIPEKYKTNLELHDTIIDVADKLYERA